MAQNSTTFFRNPNASPRRGEYSQNRGYDQNGGNEWNRNRSASREPYRAGNNRYDNYSSAAVNSPNATGSGFWNYSRGNNNYAPVVRPDVPYGPPRRGDGGGRYMANPRGRTTSVPLSRNPPPAQVDNSNINKDWFDAEQEELNIQQEQTNRVGESRRDRQIVLQVPNCLEDDIVKFDSQPQQEQPTEKWGSGGSAFQRYQQTATANTASRASENQYQQRNTAFGNNRQRDNTRQQFAREGSTQIGEGRGLKDYGCPPTMLSAASNFLNVTSQTGDDGGMSHVPPAQTSITQHFGNSPFTGTAAGTGGGYSSTQYSTVHPVQPTAAFSPIAPTSTASSALTKAIQDYAGGQIPVNQNVGASRSGFHEQYPASQVTANPALSAAQTEKTGGYSNMRMNNEFGTQTPRAIHEQQNVPTMSSTPLVASSMLPPNKSPDVADGRFARELFMDLVNSFKDAIKLLESFSERLRVLTDKR